MDHELVACVVPPRKPRGRSLEAGLRLGNGFHLDRLAEACANDGRYAFLFAAPPLPTARAFDTLINPLAVK